MPDLNLIQLQIAEFPLNSKLFVSGATGTGKELAARAIHDMSPRRNNAFVDINCSAIPETLIEAELFGHQRGTFTGAHENRSGLFEKASGGTLFLDEVDALNLSAQAKLLRVLQERTVRRIGARADYSHRAARHNISGPHGAICHRSRGLAAPEPFRFNRARKQRRRFSRSWKSKEGA